MRYRKCSYAAIILIRHASTLSQHFSWSAQALSASNATANLIIENACQISRTTWGAFSISSHHDPTSDIIWFAFVQFTLWPGKPVARKFWYPRMLVPDIDGNLWRTVHAVPLFRSEQGSVRGMTGSQPTSVHRITVVYIILLSYIFVVRMGCYFGFLSLKHFIDSSKIPNTSTRSRLSPARCPPTATATKVART